MTRRSEDLTYRCKSTLQSLLLPVRFLCCFDQLSYKHRKQRLAGKDDFKVQSIWFGVPNLLWGFVCKSVHCLLTKNEVSSWSSSSREYEGITLNSSYQFQTKSTVPSCLNSRYWGSRVPRQRKLYAARCVSSMAGNQSQFIVWSNKESLCSTGSLFREPSVPMKWNELDLLWP